MILEAPTVVKYLFLIACLLLYFPATVHAGKVTNGLIDTEFSNECFYNKSADIVLLLDGSGSVGDNSFASQIDFAILFARRLNISEEGTHLGVSQFADESRVEIGLGVQNNPQQLESSIQRIPFIGGGTLTGRALQFIESDAFAGARGGDVPKVLVVLTDGQSQDNVYRAAQVLREKGVTIYAIGVTNLVNARELQEIAGNGGRTFAVDSLETIHEQLANSITLDMCQTDFRPGEPEIICGPDHIGVRAATKEPFDGFVFVQDHFHDEECRAGAMDFDDPKLVSLNIPFNKCNVHRYRSIEPRGIFVEATIVFMFHMTFMTQVDHMVKVQCFYMEADKTVSNDMEVSMIPTLFREKMYEMPTCYYTLRKGAPDGPELDYAQLGDEVFHRWECLEKNPEYDTFGMLVHSCYVDNGIGDKVDILDSKGCGIDPVLLQTPDYDESLRLANKHYWVFKYADKPVLQFQCQITLCIKYDNGCAGITPPSCPVLPRKHRSRRANQVNASSVEDHEGDRRSIEEADDTRKVATLDVFTNAMTIYEKAPPTHCDYRSESIFEWINPLHMAIITSFNLLLSLSTVIIWITTVRTRSRRAFHIGA